MDSESTPCDHPAFAPMVVGHTDSHRARVASAHDETREEPGPGLRQEAQIVLFLLPCNRAIAQSRTDGRDMAFHFSYFHMHTLGAALQ